MSKQSSNFDRARKVAEGRTDGKGEEQLSSYTASPVRDALL